MKCYISELSQTIIRSYIPEIHTQNNITIEINDASIADIIQRVEQIIEELSDCQSSPKVRTELLVLENFAVQLNRQLA